MNAESIIKAAIPDAPDWIMDHIIWGRTPYPFANITAKQIYKAASGYKRATDNGHILCDFCERLCDNNKKRCCEICESILIKCRQQ